MSDHLRSPTAGLGCGVVCTTFGFAQKRDAKPVGGRGISGFSQDFFFHLADSMPEAEYTVTSSESH